ncbi:putative bifunctional diguanylate cyclase/phosphodiesterase [Uliginosibacterium paludis]|uniref:EAL domain-containing protein n=1 Tax=Uliginosibacterium paludis TaxID=1615952 RepID=A0ABV2CQD9_9RHOO
MQGNANNLTARITRMKWFVVALTLTISGSVLLIINFFHGEYLVIREELIPKIDALRKIESQILRLRTHALYITLEDDRSRVVVHKERSFKSFDELESQLDNYSVLPRKEAEQLLYEKDKLSIYETWKRHLIVVRNAEYYDESAAKNYLRWEYMNQSGDSVLAIDSHLAYLKNELAARQNRLRFWIVTLFASVLVAMVIRILITFRHSKMMEDEIRNSAETIKLALMKVKKEFDLGIRIPAINNEFGLVANEINQLINYFGKNYSVFDKKICEDEIRLGAELQNAITANELSLVYQPIVDTRSGRPGKVETLLRWHSAKFGPVPPDRFIPIAERHGQIVEIENWVIKSALAQQKRWLDESGLDLAIAINVSAPHFLTEGFAAFMKREVRAAGCKPERVELEVTESVMISDINSGILALQELSEFGIRISLDDFGTGYSSLSYLARFRFHVLKIDRSFVSALDSEEAFKLVNGIVRIGHALSMQVVAEGVETPEQLQKLKDIGCDQVQGYYFSRPVVPAEIVPLVKAGSANRHSG